MEESDKLQSQTISPAYGTIGVCSRFPGCIASPVIVIGFTEFPSAKA